MLPVSSSSAGAGSPGFGLGLRTPHYADFLAGPQPVDWLEIITDNFLVEGGRPLQHLDRLRRDYPMACHGVAMSLGAAQGLDLAYLARVKALADRIEPMWVSDHLCWTGFGPHCLHDLYPLPYTDEAARRVIGQIRQAQDVLQRRLVIENVSSYVRYAGSQSAEWEFLAHVAAEADCELLVDVNNVYVSSVNHGFDPLRYLEGLPASRVRQFHLAGHADHGDHIVDTHDHPVAPAVWALYRQACQRFGAVATLLERDDRIPPLAELLEELAQARRMAADPAGEPAAVLAPGVSQGPGAEACGAPVLLAGLQETMADHVLDRASTRAASTVVDAGGPLPGERGLAIYHHAYRARLAEVLGDSHARTRRYMGDEDFDEQAMRFAVAQPPAERSLGRYGAACADFLRETFPLNPELFELARLDWDLRACFDGPDVAALSASQAQADADGLWLQRSPALHPSLVMRSVQTNVVALWKALEADDEVPPPERLPQPRVLAVWRRELQPHFRSLQPGEAIFLAALTEPGASLAGVAERLGGSEALPDAAMLGEWLALWWDEGLLRGEEPPLMPERISPPGAQSGAGVLRTQTSPSW